MAAAQLDDNWKDPSAVAKTDLRRAIDAVIDGRDVDFDVVPPIGCSIEWK